MPQGRRLSGNGGHDDLGPPRDAEFSVNFHPNLTILSPIVREQALPTVIYSQRSTQQSVKRGNSS